MLSLRKQALASLHSGLQNNQGIPIAHVEKWLAMEGEDVEGLMEYHGFSIKKYEEAYMVKEGPFLNSDMDFPTRRAQLVQHKKSKTIVDDVRTALIVEELSVGKECSNNIVDKFDRGNSIISAVQPAAYDDEMMLDTNISHTSTVLTEPSSLFEERPPCIQNREFGMKMEERPVRMTMLTSPVENVCEYTQQNDSQQLRHHDNEVFLNEVTLQLVDSRNSQPAVHQNSSSCVVNEKSRSKMSERMEFECESLLPLFDQKEETKKETLKLILRKWKKQAAMRRENREQKEFLASAALSSLSLGPPTGQIEYQQTRSYEILDIGAISRARHRKIGNSWSRLNISNLVAPIMFARNPNARVICWKLVLLVQPCDPDDQTHQLALDWLFFKLLGPSKEDDTELAVCSSGLSIWKKWSDPCGSSPRTCCLSVIREKVLDDRQPIEGDVLDGTSCLVYLVSETIQWEIQRARLQNFLEALPPRSCLPLLILSIDSPRGEVAERSANITKRLALHDEKEMRICSSLVTFLADISCSKNSPSFFDDHQLRVGLQWLANNTPSAPLLCLVRTRELVLNYLTRYMEITANHKGFDVDPNDCIAGLNNALDKSTEEIMVTASMNLTHWPAPEINLLDKSSNEGILAGLCFPTTGWSSPTRIDPIIRAIKSCKLPSFPDTSWLKHESLTGVQIKQQKLALEKLLISYLNESNKLLKADIAAREVNAMLQKCVGLQNCGSGHCLIPRWTLIFQRIYSWQLNKLAAPGISNVYIMDGKNNLFPNDFPSSSGFENHHPSAHSFPAEVSLDELVEISCSNPFENWPLVSKPSPPLRSIGEVGDGVKGNDDDDEEAGMASGNHEDLRCRTSYELVPELMDTDKQISDPPVFKSDRLTALLERCNRVQDTIDQKLAIYF